MTNNAVNLGCELTRLLTYLLTRLEKYFGYTPPPLPPRPRSIPRLLKTAILYAVKPNSLNEHYTITVFSACQLKTSYEVSIAQGL